jgi:eukaryotic-like serine/threonine-protein kinase
VSLAPGNRLGPYEIVAAIGAGGMGEVYRACDTRLDRTVAIKVLPASVAADPERRARFEREARAISALNHSKICTLHDVGRLRVETASGAPAGRSEAVDFLVMEFVGGESLDARITRGPLPIDEALAIARQIADALEAAHERGIIHRDLKPANIKVTPGGDVKVLDFGLAKALDPEGESASADAMNSPTVTALSPTQIGVILGTAAYMSPEQARGRVVDKRTDIWAFGCVLYEMLTGRYAFSGDTVTDVLAAIVTRAPDLNALPAATPSSIRRLLKRCLEKDVKQRLRDIGDARVEIDDVIAGSATEPADNGTMPSPKRSPAVGRALAVIAGVLVAAAIFFAGWKLAASQPSVPASRNWEGVLLGGPAIAFEPRLSPNGQLLAFQAMVNGVTQIAVMNPRAAGWRVLTSDRNRGSAGGPNWSADSTRIYFDRYYESPEGIFSVSVFGEDLRLVLANAWAPRIMNDGSLIVSRVNADTQMQLFRFWPDSAPERLEPLNAILTNRVSPAVEVFPDGREVVFFGRPGNEPTAPEHLYALEIATGKVRRIAPDVPIDPGTWQFPLSVTDDRVLFVLPAGDLRRVVSVNRDGSARDLHALITLTARPLYMHAGTDGAIYLDQIVQPTEMIWQSPATRQIETRLTAGSSTTTITAPLALSDGRVLLQAGSTGRRRLLVYARDKPAAPFMDTPEETAMPASRLGADRVALLLGSVPKRRVAVVRASDGRVESFVDQIDGNNLSALAGTPDGRTLFYAIGGVVWKIALDTRDARPQQVSIGIQVAVDPHGRFVVVQIQDQRETRLVRLPINGGSPEPLTVSGPYRFAPGGMYASAVGPDGRILARITSRDSWYWPIGLFDPATHRIDLIDLGPDLDVGGGWTPDGRIVAIANHTFSNLWRFSLK